MSFYFVRYPLSNIYMLINQKYKNYQYLEQALVGYHKSPLVYCLVSNCNYKLSHTYLGEIENIIGIIVRTLVLSVHYFNLYLLCIKLLCYLYAISFA